VGARGEDDDLPAAGAQIYNRAVYDGQDAERGWGIP
jgi:hypothetical protein